MANLLLTLVFIWFAVPPLVRGGLLCQAYLRQSRTDFTLRITVGVVEFSVSHPERLAKCMLSPSREMGHSRFRGRFGVLGGVETTR